MDDVRARNDAFHEPRYLDHRLEDDDLPMVVTWEESAPLWPFNPYLDSPEDWYGGWICGGIDHQTKAYGDAGLDQLRLSCPDNEVAQALAHPLAQLIYLGIQVGKGGDVLELAILTFESIYRQFAECDAYPYITVRMAEAYNRACQRCGGRLQTTIEYLENSLLEANSVLTANWESVRANAESLWRRTRAPYVGPYATLLQRNQIRQLMLRIEYAHDQMVNSGLSRCLTTEDNAKEISDFLDSLYEDASKEVPPQFGLRIQEDED